MGRSGPMGIGGKQHDRESKNPPESAFGQIRNGKTSHEDT